MFVFMYLCERLSKSIPSCVEQGEVTNAHEWVEDVDNTPMTLVYSFALSWSYE